MGAGFILHIFWGDFEFEAICATFMNAPFMGVDI